MYWTGDILKAFHINLSTQVNTCFSLFSKRKNILGYDCFECFEHIQFIYKSMRWIQIVYILIWILLVNHQYLRYICRPVGLPYWSTLGIQSDAIWLIRDTHALVWQFCCRAYDGDDRFSGIYLIIKLFRLKYRWDTPMWRNCCFFRSDKTIWVAIILYWALYVRHQVTYTFILTII